MPSANIVAPLVILQGANVSAPLLSQGERISCDLLLHCNRSPYDHLLDNFGVRAVVVWFLGWLGPLGQHEFSSAMRDQGLPKERRASFPNGVDCFRRARRLRER